MMIQIFIILCTLIICYKLFKNVETKAINKSKQKCDHLWNVQYGIDDGNGGTKMLPDDGTVCLKCGSIYNAPSSELPKTMEEIEITSQNVFACEIALNSLKQNSEIFFNMVYKYPVFISFADYHFTFTSKENVIKLINILEDKLTVYRM